MLNICRKNINKWFPDLNFIEHLADIERTKFDEIFFNYSDENTTNIVLDVGSTIGNHRDMIEALSNIKSGLSSKDIFVFSNGIDLETNRTTFSYFRVDESVLQDTLIPSMLNFDVDEMILSNKFDELSSSKLETIKLDKDYSLTFKIKNKIVILKFKKDEEITIWRQLRNSIDSLVFDLDRAGLKLAGLNTQADYSHFLAICETNNK